MANNRIPRVTRVDGSVDRFVGRPAEHGRLISLVAAVRGGTGALAWLRGEPGIGKSTLIDELVAAGAGCAIFRAGGDELTEAYPLRLMADALGVSRRSHDPSRTRIAELLRGETAGTGAVDPILAAGELMLALVDRLCAAGPTVLIVEDLHWADEPSLLLWSRLARAVDQIPLLLVGSCRPVPRRARVLRLAELVAEYGGTVLELGPLVGGEAGEVAERIIGAPPGPALRAELVRAGGNPLYIRELVEALVRDRLVDSAGGMIELRAGRSVTPGSLTTTIGRRLRFLPEATIRILRLAALLGNEFDPDELGLVAGQSVPELVSALDEAVAAGVIRDTGHRLAFRHELIRQVLQEQMPASMQAGLRRHVARKLAETGAGMEVVARHLLAASGPLDAWVPQWLARVPEPMLYLVPQMSVSLLSAALGAKGLAAAQRETLAARLAYAQFRLGRDTDAVDTAQEVARRTTEPALAAGMRLLVLRATVRMGRVVDALPVIDEIATDDGTPPGWRARLRAWAAVVLALVGQRDKAVAEADAALAAAECSSDTLAIGYSRHAQALLSSSQSAVDHIEAGLAGLGTDPESQDLRLLLLNNLLTYLTLFGYWARVREIRQQALVLAERAGTFRAATLLATAGETYYLNGEWDDAELHLASVDSEFLDSGGNINARALTALLALHRGDRATAELHLRHAGRAVPESSSYAANPTNWRLTTAWALRAEADGDLHRAVELMAGWLSADGLPGQRTRHEFLPHLVRLALAVQDSGTAHAASAACQADADADPVPARLIAARSCRAILDNDAKELLSVAEKARQHGWPLQVTLALDEAAVLLAQGGDLIGARAAFNDAVRIYVDLGAFWDLRRTEARLRPFGIRRGPRSAHRQARTGWPALTPAEVHIAHLVATGMSNPDIAAELFLSRSTVQTHVSKILVKLNLRSRIGVIHEVARQAGGATR
jgi:DNA-binding CsgD family transcriptional regulator